MGEKRAALAFNGELMCFAHALLNSQDMKEKGYDIKLIIEGSATKQIKELSDSTKPFANLYEKAKGSGLIDCVCQACSSANGSYESAKEQGLPICGEMSGHPSISRYREAGYEVLVF
jgi:hypothetical protein